MKPLDTPLDVLVVAPHPDDAEISIGGTLLGCKRDGLRVGVIDLTNGEPTPQGSRQLRAAETKAATELLELDWRKNLGLPNRNLVHNLEARRALAGIFRLTKPRVILAPFHEDVHPDHVAASELADAARFWAKLSKSDIVGDPHWPERIYYYWSIHLRIHPKPAFVFDISDVIEKKMHAVRCYQSQLISGRSQQHPNLIDDIRDRARYWGWSIGTAYAEPFASREEIGINRLDSIC